MKKEEYLNIEILQNRSKKLKKHYSTLGAGFYFDGTVVEFERREVLNSFFMMIPKEFTFMPDELTDVKYPFVFRPPCILTNDNLTINLSFNELPNNLQETTFMQTTENVKKILENEQGIFDFGEVKSLNNIECYYFDFRQNAMDGELYHMLANIKLNNNIYQLTFNCTTSSYLEWKSAVLQMWESAEYGEEDRENE